MKYNGPKARKVRRQGSNIYGSDKYDKILQRKPYGPGKNPKSRPGKQSEYAKQLLEKQKMRDIYGLSESQFRKVYSQAQSAPGQTGEKMKELLERRLDNVIYRAGFAMTRLQSRQFAGHGLFMVNGRRVTVPSILVKPGDVVTVRAKLKSSPVFGPIIEAHEKYASPSWLKVDSGALKAEVIAIPGADHAEQGIDVRMVIEFYSR
ncbi:30S ribosomal protein S4 [Candidatus Peribacteria bacterium RIFCSPHIGHO2_01_FULL_55_13]|nr:MAG: 30S ribosomal protein S4 [Candidatus Peribacteria bacterium RIFCSPHIGHO2_01_FULL_55_13]OGJ64265.1 MAG: 30S ribosomal protein S4 [Candidatus Peribacteria bacterium RIFCSPHIGHO2_12_FULL_55_11]